MQSLQTLDQDAVVGRRVDLRFGGRLKVEALFDAFELVAVQRRHVENRNPHGKELERREVKQVKHEFRLMGHSCLLTLARTSELYSWRPSMRLRKWSVTMSASLNKETQISWL